MTALERALGLSRWKDLYEAQHRVAGHGGKRLKSKENDQVDIFSTCFSDVAAEVLGVNEKSIRRAITIARGIPGNIQELLQHHGLADRQSELLLLAAEPPARQAAIVALILSAPSQAASVGEAIALLDQRAIARPLPAYEKMHQRFAAMKAAEQERFFDLNADAIERWMAKKLAAQTRRAAA
jgi:ParB family chromosome partitioning protein